MMPNVEIAKLMALQRKREAAFCNFWLLVEYPNTVKRSVEVLSAKFSAIDKRRLP